MSDKSIKANIVLSLFFLLPFSFSHAYDHKTTHRVITETSFAKSNIAPFLKQYLGMTGNSKINGQEIIKWISDGSESEDSPSCRATNHFHNPLKNWGESGLSDIPWWLNVECSSWNPWYSNVTWGTGYLSPDGPQITRPRQWMGWGDARDYFYWALTSVSNQERESYFAKTFQALGQVLHLNQDVSVPAHVRNDFKSHYASYDPYHKPMSVYPNQFEAYVRKNPQLIANTEARPPVFLNPKITDFWDADQYIGDNPSASLSLGLAEFVHANYFSDWTIPNNTPNPEHKFPYPKVDSSNSRICEDFAPDSADVRRYISRKECPPLSEARAVDHFAAVSLINDPSSITDDNIGKMWLHLDDNVNHTYAQEILPRAVGYSAGLLDYFFRGQLQVTSLPIFFKNNLSYIKLKIKNLTPTKETMMNGNFILTYRYTPKGRAKDGSEDVFGRAWTLNGDLFVPCVELKYYEQAQNAMEVYFQMIPTLSSEEYESIQFMLTFKGTLGKEEAAVIGKYFTPGEVPFYEEWDKGLPGKHAWGHEGVNLFMGNTTNGYSSNVIVGDTLVKDSVRYANVGQSRTNYSWVGVFCCNHEQFKDIFPIPVTRNTSLMFKINQMWINPVPPFPEEASHWQGLWLHFSNGYALQFTQPGQGVYEGDKTGIYSFTLGNNILGNIYDLFAGVGIQIPEGPFSLESISLVQVLFSLGGKLPWEIEYQQHMEIDFIQIIEQKEQ
jgi:hypothetical protein